MKSLRIAGVLAVGLVLAACGSGGSDKTSGGSEGPVAGDITILTNRTDLIDTDFKDYKKQFEKKYPKVNVKFEGITDYEGEVRIRMNTKDYGDVLLIPNSVAVDQLPTFFEPLGSTTSLQKQYRFVNEQSYQGKGYGLAIVGNAQGFAYNKKIWTQAGVTQPPTTPQELLTDLKAIKDTTDAVPLYTNYKDGWPLTQWEGNRGAITADPDAVNKLSDDAAPWAAGKEHNVIDSLLFDAVRNGLTEDDPTTTDWESSKKLLGTGKVASMMLGSWSIVQMQAAASSPADIGYLPFPVQVDGKFHSVLAGDYKNAINVNSENKAAARAWLDWFANESSYATDQGGISPLLDKPFPDALADFKVAGVEYLELSAQPKGQEGLVNRIDNAAEIGLLDGKYRQRLIDAARGAKKESKQQIFSDLDKKWADARATATDS